MNIYLKTWLYSSISLLAVQLTAEPLLAQAEGADPAAAGRLNVTSAYMKDGALATFTSNLSAVSPGYLTHLTNDNISMARVDHSQQLFYSVPRAGMSEGSYIDLDISYSDLLVPTSSTLTIAVDGRPVKSIPLTKETSSRLVTRIPLGNDDVTPGFHAVTLDKHSTISNDVCSDEENPANWVRINRSSAIFLNTATTFTTNDVLRNYPFPFVEPSIQNEMYGAVMLPDHPSAELIASAMQVATYFSSKTATKRPTPIVTESEWLSKDHLLPALALGSINAWSGPVKQMLQNNPVHVHNQQLSLDAFAVTEQASNETRQVLLVSAVDDKVIKDRIHLLTEKDFVDQLAGNHLMITDAQQAADVQAPTKPITFESVGTSNIKLDETHLNSERLFYTIPSFWSLTGESQLTLKVRVSSLLQNDSALSRDNKSTSTPAPTANTGLTVIINDVPKTFSFAEIVASQKADDSYLLTVPLAPYLKENKTNVLTMSFSAQLNEAHNACGPKSDSGKWIFIDKSSTLQLPHEILKETSFRNWPAPFVDDNGLGQTVFLLPKDVGGTLLSQFAAMIRSMTSDVSKNTAVDIVRDGDPDLEQKLKGHNVVIVGNPSDFQSLQAYKDTLVLGPGNEQLRLANPNLINETTDYAAWIQTSLWDKVRVMAVFQAGANNQKAADTFTNASLLQFLSNEQKSSQAVVMSKSGEVVAFDTKSMEQAKPETTPASAARSNISLIWAAAAIGVVFIIGLILFIRLLRRPK
ncbi:cellulose biosynthesis cyclic di-GMP-binding regulatory protein BcsB [Paenibacillus sp. SI8]|uniref:cellulose biosynthesis cyclic di-GMP-binding regulatory protein BcsB n=1 Tax=unclassified Paenibacillus TaxID=185978 RepID=UPI003465E9F6